MQKTTDDKCACGTGRKYVECCGRWHAGEAAPDAQALMRSRYTAFVRGLGDYILATWHPSKRPPSIELDPAQKWLGLKIVEAQTTGADSAEVEFIARFRIGGASAARLHERSRFVREGGRWLYVDGSLREL
jgi:SEC-C motif-containing protein